MSPWFGLMNADGVGGRLSYGVIGRLPRMVLKGGLTLKGHFLAEGVSVLVVKVFKGGLH